MNRTRPAQLPIKPFLFSTGFFATLFLFLMMLAAFPTEEARAQRQRRAFSPPDNIIPGTITIDATGEAMVPADIIHFHINITTSGRTPSEVFEEHKRQERYLAGLIREMGIDESKLTFQPIQIGSRQMRETVDYTSSQQVRLELEDFELYEQLQVRLIENGFENFRGQFSSTKLDEGEKEALELAVANAREKAERIAALMGKNLGEVREIEHTTQRVFRSEVMAFAEARVDTGLLTEFSQMIPVSSTIRIIYRIR